MIPLPDFIVGGVVRGTFILKKPSDGVTPVNADSTPTYTILKNGTANGESLTVSAVSGVTGGYAFAYDPAGDAEGDFYSIIFSATITDAAFNSGSAYTHKEVFCVRCKAVERGTDSAALAATALTNVTWTDAKAAFINAAIDSRMATYTQPTGFLAATFPSDPADQSLIIDATNTILARLPASLNGGRMECFVGEMGVDVMNVAATAEALVTWIQEGIATTTELNAAAQSIKDYGDGAGAWGAVGDSGGGDALEATSQEILGIVEDIQTKVSSATITTTGYAAFNSSGVLQLKEGHTATLTFTSTTNNVVSDLTSARVYLSVREVSGTPMIQVQGTVLVATGLQSVQFAIDAASAKKLRKGKCLFDVVAVYGYDASLTPPYTGLEPFTGGNADVTRLELQL